MSGYLPTKDLQLQQWLANFVQVATENEPALGLIPADLAPIALEQSQFTASVSATQDAKINYETAVKTKAGVHKSLTKSVRTVVKKIQGNPSVPASLKTSLGINAGGGARTKTAPITPTTLVATPQATGVNTLAWNKSGNKTATQYVVYAKALTPGASITAETGWTMVGQTTRSKFDHVGVTPGQPLAYKVVAARANQASLPSAPVTVYGA